MSGSIIRCFCGREFSQQNAYGSHQRACKRSKTQFASVLDQAKEIFAQKKQKTRHSAPALAETTPAPPLAELPTEVEPEDPPDDDQFMSLASRRPRRPNVPMPKRYRDLLPQPAPSLSPANLRPHSPLDTASEMETSAGANLKEPSSLPSRMRRVIRTPRNLFGLVRQYFAERLPTVDPEEHVTLADMSPADTKTQPNFSWFPFPNKNSFLLANWHWNGGLQKSQSEFKDLLDIVGDPSFNPDDVRDTKWTKIFASLGDSNEHGDGVCGEWLDERCWMEDNGCRDSCALSSLNGEAGH
jgi:hypothetical protein